MTTELDTTLWREGDLTATEAGIVWVRPHGGPTALLMPEELVEVEPPDYHAWVIEFTAIDLEEDGIGYRTGLAYYPREELEPVPCEDQDRKAEKLLRAQVLSAYATARAVYLTRYAATQDVGS